MGFRCCKCCLPGNSGYNDHVDQGGIVERDEHEVPCPTCQEKDLPTEDELTDVLMKHHVQVGVMASSTHWAHRSHHGGEDAWFAHCGTGYDDQQGCGWDSEPTVYADKMEAKRAALYHVASEIVEALR